MKLDTHAVRRGDDPDAQVSPRLARDLRMFDGRGTLPLPDFASEKARSQILHQRVKGHGSTDVHDIGKRAVDAELAWQLQIERLSRPLEQLTLGQVIDGRRSARRALLRRCGSRIGRATPRERHEGDRGSDKALRRHSSTAAQELMSVGATGVGSETE